LKALRDIPLQGLSFTRIMMLFAVPGRPHPVPITDSKAQVTKR
jgi:hypothetical protein